MVAILSISGVVAGYGRGDILRVVELSLVGEVTVVVESPLRVTA